MVDLEDHGFSRPRQPVGPGVEPGGQDDGLAHTGRGGVDEEGIEEPGANSHPFGEPLRCEGGIVVIEFDVAVHHTDEGVDADRAHQWLGKGIIEQRVGALRRQRPAGGDGAVAPTLDAKSQVSPSYRVASVPAIS